MDNRQREIRLKGERQAEQTLIALSLVFGAVCLYFALRHGDLAWFAGLAPSAALFVLALGAMADKRPRLLITKDGVEDRAIGVGMVPWSAIAAMEETAVRQSRFLSLRLHDPAAWRARMPVWRRLVMDIRAVFGVTPFSIDAQSFKVDADDLFTVIVRRWQDAVTEPRDARLTGPDDPDPKTARH